MPPAIPKQDGRYWLEKYEEHWMCQVFTDGGGSRTVMVMSKNNPTGFDLYPVSDPIDIDLEGSIFTKIEVPR